MGWAKTSAKKQGNHCGGTARARRGGMMKKHLPLLFLVFMAVFPSLALARELPGPASSAASLAATMDVVARVLCAFFLFALSLPFWRLAMRCAASAFRQSRTGFFVLMGMCLFNAKDVVSNKNGDNGFPSSGNGGPQLTPPKQPAGGPQQNPPANPSSGGGTPEHGSLLVDCGPSDIPGDDGSGYNLTHPMFVRTVIEPYAYDEDINAFGFDVFVPAEGMAVDIFSKTNLTQQHWFYEGQLGYWGSLVHGQVPMIYDQMFFSVVPAAGWTYIPNPGGGDPGGGDPGGGDPGGGDDPGGGGDDLGGGGDPGGGGGDPGNPGGGGNTGGTWTFNQGGGPNGVPFVPWNPAHNPGRQRFVAAAWDWYGDLHYFDKRDYTVTIPANEQYLFVVYLTSSKALWQFHLGSDNDRMIYKVKQSGPSTAGMSAELDLHSRWGKLGSHNWPYYWARETKLGPCWGYPEAAYLFSAPHNHPLTIDVSLEVELVKSSYSNFMATGITQVEVEVYPLTIWQENYPNFGWTGDDETTTDLGATYRKCVRIPPHGTGYVTGEPATPAIGAWFMGLPEKLEVDWKLDIVSERKTPGKADRKTLDDLTSPANGYTRKRGGWDMFNFPWNYPEALQAVDKPMLGGKCTLSFQSVRFDPTNPNMDWGSGSVEFKVRGKNPKDEDVRTFIDENVDHSLTNIAWGIFVHETKQYDKSIAKWRIYNQFNSEGGYKEMPNWGEPNGWGIGQIDRNINTSKVETDEVWNWKTNVINSVTIMLQKRDDHQRFMRYIKEDFGVDPPATNTVNGFTFTAEEWGTMILYNGPGDIDEPDPKKRGIIPKMERPQGKKPKKYTSPVHYNPITKTWKFYDNHQNYADHVSKVLKNTPPITPPTTD